MRTFSWRRISLGILVFFLVVIAAISLFIWWSFVARRASDTTHAQPKSGKNQINSENTKAGNATANPFKIIAKNLEVPWALDFLPDGRMILTERAGRIRIIDRAGKLQKRPLAVIRDVNAVGEGGLLGLTLHPDFALNPYVYVYFSYESAGGIKNRVERYRFNGDGLSTRMILINNIPGGAIHNGGRIKFGPDGLLYITTGDSGNADLAQRLDSLAGKILRCTDNGSIPPDNPFPGSLVYSYGHRNPQGLAWDDQGRLWATEHGPNAHDEINRIEAGANYGWPVIVGDEANPKMRSPILQSGLRTWAPSGAAFHKGKLYFTGLRGQGLFRLSMKGDKPKLDKLIANKFGRLRTIELGPDGFLYIMTNNRDGRGVPVADDDQIIRVRPQDI